MPGSTNTITTYFCDNYNNAGKEEEEINCFFMKEEQKKRQETIPFFFYSPARCQRIKCYSKEDQTQTERKK